MEFRGELITLKELCEDYFDEYITMFSSKVRRILHVTDEGCERQFLYYRLMQHDRREVFFFCMFDNASQKLIGSIELRSPNDSRGQLGVWLNEAFWGGGRFLEALTLIVEAYFERSGIDVVTAHVDTSNIRSYKALKKFGFIDVATIDGPYGKQYALAYKRRRHSSAP